ncbi:MAG: cation-transporting P-type ATPase [Desulfobacterales bacterium]
MTELVVAVHIAVRGRARFKVAGLRNGPVLKHILEFYLPQHPDLIRAAASTTTGNLLVVFSENLTADTVRDLIVQAVNRRAVDLDVQPPPETGGSRGAEPAEDAALQRLAETDITGSIRAGLKSAMSRMVDDAAVSARTAWHTLARNTLGEVLETDFKTGLTEEDARRRLAEGGANRLPEADARSDWEIIFDQINSLPVYLLGAAAFVSVLTGGFIDAVVVMGVVAANAAIGYVTETRAEKTISSLRRFVNPVALVQREGQTRQIPAHEVVVGDLLVLKPGMYVPADARLIEASHLSVDESMLTGESMPVMKSATTLRIRNTPLADRLNMVYMGTLVTGGQATAVVVATGSRSEIGRLQLLLEQTESPETPIERQLRIMGDQLVILCGMVCGFVFLIGFLRGYGFLPMLRSAISLAASAVPEGLPAAATINFALGIRRMQRDHVLIRRLQAVETLGSIQTICLDKTGTITRNRMTVTRIVTAGRRIEVDRNRFQNDHRRIDPLSAPEIEALLTCGCLCSETRINGAAAPGEFELHGSSTENALVFAALAAGMDIRECRRTHPLIFIQHRSEQRPYMVSRHQTASGRQRCYVKGSPPEVLAMCRWQLEAGAQVELDRGRRRDIERLNDAMSGDALRVLGLAMVDVDADDQQAMENRLIWLGLVGMTDPIRQGVKPLIDVLHRAGIETVMITGDQSTTAFAIADKLGIAGENRLEILDSSELTSVDPELLAAIAKRVHVYSRVSPAHKLRIVQAIQSSGRTVAMTGDGINDGPALKAADLGIAMGETGTDVAREVADVVLEKDNLETLVVAVRDGRATYENIRKSVRFFLGTNMTEIMVMAAAMTLGIGFPLNVMQLLWINIISDIFPGLALSVEDPEPDILERPPRDSQAPLFAREDFKRMTVDAALMSAGSLGAYAYGLSRYGAGARSASLAFQSLTIGQLLNAYSCRSQTHSLFERRQLPPNPYLNVAILGSLALQGLTIWLPPVRRLLGVAPLGLADLGVIGGTALLSLAAIENAKPRRG